MYNKPYISNKRCVRAIKTIFIADEPGRKIFAAVG
jgi:hypothetical protein